MGTLFVLMGSTKTRKSATIRALTGFTRNNNGEIRPLDVRRTNGEIIKICVFSISPQEANIGVPEFAKKITDLDQNWNILLALHPNDKALEYIQAIPQANRHEIHIAPLGMAEIPDNLQRELRELQLKPQIIHPGIANSRNMPANEIAHQIRDRWGWR